MTSQLQPFTSTSRPASPASPTLPPNPPAPLPPSFHLANYNFPTRTSLYSVISLEFTTNLFGLEQHCQKTNTQGHYLIPIHVASCSIKAYLLKKMSLTLSCIQLFNCLDNVGIWRMCP